MGMPESKNRVGLGRALMKGRNIGAGAAQKGGKNRVKGTQSHVGVLRLLFGSPETDLQVNSTLQTSRRNLGRLRSKLPWTSF